MLSKNISKEEILRKGNANLEWYCRNLKSLKEKYTGQYVAVYDRKVVDSDDSPDTLVARLKNNTSIDQRWAFVQYVSKPGERSVPG